MKDNLNEGEKQLYELVKLSEEKPPYDKVCAVSFDGIEIEQMAVFKETTQCMASGNGAGYFHDKFEDEYNQLVLSSVTHWLRPLPKSKHIEDSELVFFSQYMQEVFSKEGLLTYPSIRDAVGAWKEIRGDKKPNPIDSEKIRQLKAVIIHFATLDKMPTLELLNREGLLDHVVTRAKNVLDKYPVTLGKNSIPDSEEIERMAEDTFPGSHLAALDLRAGFKKGCKAILASLNKQGSDKEK